ncbi:unnamed protein product [Rhizoctonia solani]|uniref:Uncharacterized protein n=1 Tax=Rhizoctonia solani TaxID=456999 RepID=A0A8H3BG83_9AGAM|nr:unnamed protein product [Rhizoctonia solani]
MFRTQVAGRGHKRVAALRPASGAGPGVRLSLTRLHSSSTSLAPPALPDSSTTAPACRLRQYAAAPHQRHECEPRTPNWKPRRENNYQCAGRQLTQFLHVQLRSMPPLPPLHSNPAITLSRTSPTSRERGLESTVGPVPDELWARGRAHDAWVGRSRVVGRSQLAICQPNTCSHRRSILSSPPSRLSPASLTNPRPRSRPDSMVSAVPKRDDSGPVVSRSDRFLQPQPSPLRPVVTPTHTRHSRPPIRVSCDRRSWLSNMHPTGPPLVYPSLATPLFGHAVAHEPRGWTQRFWRYLR